MFAKTCIEWQIKLQPETEKEKLKLQGIVVDLCFRFWWVLYYDWDILLKLI